MFPRLLRHARADASPRPLLGLLSRPLPRLPRRRRLAGFTILELLLVVAVLGGLAALVLARIGAAKERAYLAALKSDLRNLATAQELTLDQAGRYAATPAALPGFALSPDVQVVDAGRGADGWYALLRHAKSRAVCALVGSAVVPGGPTIPVGHITCAPDLALGLAVSATEPDPGTPVTFTADLAGLSVGGSDGPVTLRDLVRVAQLHAAALGEEVTQLYWNFGDGAVASGPLATLQVVTHTYATVGRRTVTLAATTDQGRVFTGSTEVAVGGVTTPPASDPEAGGDPAGAPPNQAPVATFALSAAEVGPGEPVSVDASGATDPDGRIVAYAWTFGDGRVGADARMQVDYLTPGRYAITLTVTDDNGATAATTKTVVVRAPAPAAAFTASPDVPQPGDVVTFSAAGSTGEGLTYAWDFGDFSDGASGPTAQHEYAAGGRFVARLSVTDVWGRIATADGAITVNTPPVLTVLTMPNEVVVDSTVTFAVVASDADGDAVSLTWYLDGVHVSPDQETSWTTRFPALGTHALRIHARDARNGFASRTDSFTVVPPAIVASVAISPTVPSAGDPVTFDGRGSATRVGTITSYAWQFTDGTTASGPTVTTTLPMSGSVTATLTVTNSAGLTATTSRTVSGTAFGLLLYASPYNLTAGPTTFSSYGQGLGGETITSTTWQFPDASTASGTPLTKTLVAPPLVYRVWATATTSGGRTLTGCLTLWKFSSTEFVPGHAPDLRCQEWRQNSSNVTVLGPSTFRFTTATGKLSIAATDPLQWVPRASSSGARAFDNWQTVTLTGTAKPYTITSAAGSVVLTARLASGGSRTVNLATQPGYSSSISFDFPILVVTGAPIGSLPAASVTTTDVIEITSIRMYK